MMGVSIIAQHTLVDCQKSNWQHSSRLLKNRSADQFRTLDLGCTLAKKLLGGW
jgi:hypothetical protein